jgi:Fe-S oxidoreductase
MSSATRATFQGLDSAEVTLWYALSALSTLVFVLGCVLLVGRYRRGRASGAPRPEIGRAVRVVLAHAWIRRRDRAGGLAHAAVFYGFLVLFAGTVVLAIDDHVTGPLGWHFWRGGFYEAYSLFLDVFGAGMLVGLLVFVARRLMAWPRLDYRRIDSRPVSAKRARYPLDDWVFLWSLIFLGATGFLLEAFRVAIDPPSFEVWSPVGYTLGSALHGVGLSGAAADAARFVTWWVHGVVALSFVAAIPFTKAMHMLTGPSSVAVRDEHAGRILPAEPEAGYARLADFNPRHLLQLDACTKCGKCHIACPAASGGMPLSPRDLILDLREASASGVAEPVVPAALAAKTLWSCMQCMACVEICPVGIEHVPIINLVRRDLVERGLLDDSLQSVFESVFTSGNSFGEPRRKRPRWARELEPPLQDARREAVDVLWYVGDFASFDPRNQRNTLALARLLARAGVDVGILYEAEQTAGNDIRRAGEEGLFRSLADRNISALAECHFNRILTSDPHTFNTLRNEYPSLGAPWLQDAVVHHSQLLLELLDRAALSITAPLTGRATYHDPCALGRYNNVYDQPRELIRRTGIELVEMPRNRDNSFCCGAGGGRIWMEETARPGSIRPSEQRIAEALELGEIDFFIVACPKDVTMYEDAIKTSGHSADIELREISELLLAATDATTYSSSTRDAVAPGR